MKWLLPFLACWITGEVYATVYRCTDHLGRVTFRDLPCSGTQEQQSFAPISYPRTDLKVVKREQQALEKADKQLTKTVRKRDQSTVKARKRAMAAEKRAQKKAMRCQDMTEKIATVQAQLRNGCKVKRFLQLHERLKRYQAQQERYCVDAEPLLSVRPE